MIEYPDLVLKNHLNLILAPVLGDEGKLNCVFQIIT